MKTIISNETAVWQKSDADEGGHVLSVIKTGSFFRFAVETMVPQPAENGIDAYTYPEELYRSGLYPDPQAAQDAAMCFRS